MSFEQRIESRFAGKITIPAHSLELSPWRDNPIGDGNRLEAGRAVTLPCGFDSHSFR